MAVAEEEDVNPPYLHPAYEITVSRAPSKRLVQVQRGWFHHARGPAWGRVPVRPGDNDLTKQHPGRPSARRSRCAGACSTATAAACPTPWSRSGRRTRRAPTSTRPIPGFMSLDPNFTGAGRTITDSEGRYDFRTIKPAAYPGELGGLFRPAHIHTSLFGPLLAGRLVTQCYFEGDPLLDRDPILHVDPRPRGASGCSRASTRATPRSAASTRRSPTTGTSSLRGPRGNADRERQ